MSWNDVQEDDELNEIEDIKSEKDSILFVIDCSSSMMSLSNNGEVPFICSIKCASSTMQNKIISSGNDHIGVLLYNTKEFKNSSRFENIYTLHNLDIPDVSRITELEELSQNPSKLLESIGSSEQECSLGNVFWACSNLFSSSAQKGGYKRIFLFTNQDDPHADNLALRNGAIARAKDLLDLGIQIELFNINRLDRRFDMSLFYINILGSIDDEEISRYPDSTDKFEELLARIRRKESKKRALLRLSLTVGAGMDVGCRIYSLFNEAKKGGYVYLDAKTNLEVKSVTEWICQDTGSVLSSTDMEFYYPFGGEKAIFTKEEISKLKYFGPPGLLLLGFKPQSRLKVYHNIRHSYFLVPDDYGIKGSSNFLSAMLKKLDEMGKMAICRFIPRQNSAPRLVALIPQMEKCDENGVQLKPPGFNVIFLPFNDDLRNPHIESIEKATYEQIDKAKEIISKLTIATGFSYEDYENPIIQKHYANLQALALDQDIPDEITDHTKPNVEKMIKRAGNLIEEFKCMIPAEDAPVKEKKRKTTAEVGHEKKSKVIADDFNMKDVVGDEKKLSKLTVPDLKNYLMSVGIKPGKLKADLIEQVKEHFKK